MRTYFFTLCTNSFHRYQGAFTPRLIETSRTCFQEPRAAVVFRTQWEAKKSSLGAMDYFQE
jgi:hypothetical protein